MAKQTGGLLAFSATGQIAKTMVYSSWRGRQYVRRYVIPANPQTGPQVSNRSLFAYLNNLWKMQPGGLGGAWIDGTKGRPLTDRNLFLKTNQHALQGQTDISLIELSTAVGGGVLGPVPAITNTLGTVHVTSADPVPPNGWTTVQFYATLVQNDDPFTFVGTPTWYYNTDLTSPYDCTITVPTGHDYVWQCWFLYHKPDGSNAWSPPQGGVISL